MSDLATPHWLKEVVNLLDAMAREGICMDGQADPVDLVVDLALALGCEDQPDLRAAIIKKLESTI
jgi:hypothetical protein